ncbi:DUF5992 family protein [Alteromonas sp. ASW11-130]|uniref:DUF5992 family protein n=1 Tax=Alteromonas sp. ASW11-130 TaxID=3015775 RepID=UPI002242323B|nr:DUF5992 family protein [Alteromonas sp. ASW11-130]MCW8090202.1 DUF5992 family protein [Alteromonas sp. ASW11-130]
MKKLAIFVGVLLASMSVVASQGYMIKDATATKVSATSNNIDAFWLHYSGGSGDKCGGKVKFMRTYAGTDGVFDRAFTLATTAVVAGNKIEVYSYTNNTNCESAVSINLLN